jgi:glycerol-3-phosphate acyltransferase PlsY
MTAFLVRLICLAAGYCFGIFQTAYIYGRTKGIDIRTLGSGNAGTTNVLRNFGKKAGAIVFIGDIAKCVLAYYLCSMIFGFSGVPGRLLGLYGAVGAVIGHCFPFYMQFRGGKGIACLVGLMIAFSPQTLLIGVAVFFAVFAVTNYVSLGSLLCVLAFLITTIIKGQSGAYNMSGAELIEMYLVLSAVVALTWYQHRENIKRLLSGAERKTYLFKKNK